MTTVCLSLFRPFTEKARPPRALWVPFPFGRPLGAPNNRAIQRKVLLAAFDLFNRSKGPVLEEFELDSAEEHLDARNQKAGKSCGPKGCNFDEALTSEGETAVSISAYDGNFDNIRREIATLKNHHAAYRVQYGGATQVGHSGITPEDILDAALFIHRYVSKEPVEVPSSAPLAPNKDAQLRLNLFIRLCTDDLKAFYLESRLQEKGGNSENASDYNDWLWLLTKAGSLIAAARDRVIETTDRAKDPNWILARAMVTRGYGDSGYVNATKTE